VADELFPAVVSLVAEVNMYEGVVSGTDRFGDKRHVGFFRCPPAFFNVALHTRANYIRPRRLPPGASRYHVVERQFAGREFPSAVLAVVFIASEDISAVEFHIALRQPVIKKKPDNTRHSYMEINRRNPVVTVRLEVALEPADIAPAFEIMVRIYAFIDGYYFRKLAKKQRERPPCPHDSDRHIMLVQHKNVAVQSRLVSCRNHFTIQSASANLYIPKKQADYK